MKATAAVLGLVALLAALATASPVRRAESVNAKRCPDNMQPSAEEEARIAAGFKELDDAFRFARGHADDRRYVNEVLDFYTHYQWHIPINYWVLTDLAGNNNVTEQMLEDQTTVMTDSYMGTREIKSRRMSFYTNQITYGSSDTYVALCNYDDFPELISALSLLPNFDTTAAMQVVVCPLEDGILGFSPFNFWFSDGSPLWTNFIHSESVPGGDFSPYDEGKTLVHEAGHHFGLLHTFQDGCTRVNDGMRDTPAVAEANFGCPNQGSVDSCPDLRGFDDVRNFMDYVDDACMDRCVQACAGLVLVSKRWHGWW